MTLIAALLGLAVDRLLTHLHEIRRYDWFLEYFDWMRGRLHGGVWDQWAGLVTILAPLLLSVGLLQGWTVEWLSGLVGLLFYVGVFVYCVGPRDLGVDVETWCEACGSTNEGLRTRAAQRLLDCEPDSEPRRLDRQLVNAVLVQANDRVFAVLFWFVLLGPVGAVLYRSVSLLAARRSDLEPMSGSIDWFYGALLWLPARLVAAAYALSGHFEAALEGWKRAHQEQPTGVAGSERVLVETGDGALGGEDRVLDCSEPGGALRATMRLVWRSLIIWVVLLALLTLYGWAS